MHRYLKIEIIIKYTGLSYQEIYYYSSKYLSLQLFIRIKKLDILLEYLYYFKNIGTFITRILDKSSKNYYKKFKYYVK